MLNVRLLSAKNFVQSVLSLDLIVSVVRGGGISNDGMQTLKSAGDFKISNEHNTHSPMHR